MNRFRFKPPFVLVIGIFVVLILGGSACSGRPTSQPDGSAREATAAGPGDGGEEDSGHVTITFAASEYERGLYEPLMEEFNGQNPSITVQFAPIPEPQPGDEMEEYNYLRTLATTGDTFMGGNWGLGMGARAYFRDLGPLIDADPNFEPEDFWPGVLNACQDLDGRVLGVPFLINFTGIFYDPEAFESAGLPRPEPGWTWEDFRQTVAALAQGSGDEVRYGYADRSYLNGSILAPLVGQHLDKHGGEIDAESLDAELGWYWGLAEAEAIYPLRTIEDEDWGADWEQWQAMFAGEDRPVMWSGYLTEPLPKESVTISGEEDDPFAWMALGHDGFLPYPVSEDRSGANTTPAYATCGAMSAGTSNPRAAWAWLSFLSRKWLIRDQTQAYEFMQMPSRQSVTDEAGFWGKLPVGLEPSLRFAGGHAWFGSQYPLAFEAVNQALGKSLSGKADLAAAIAEAKAGLARTPEPTPDTAEIRVATPLPPPPAEASVVDYYYEAYDPYGPAAMKTLIESFNKENPDIFIKMSQQYSGPPEGEDYFDYMTGKFDCLTWYTPSFQYQNPENLLDLTALIEAEDPAFIGDFSSEQLEAYRFEGELLGLPAYSQPQIIAYNADLLARRGLSPPQEDWTFDDFIELATKAASNSEADKSYGLLFNEWEYMLLAGRGVEWADLKSDPPVAKFDSPEMAGALAWLAEMADSGVFLIESEDNYQDIEQAFSSGQVAFWTAQVGNKEGWYFYGGPTGEGNPPKIGVAPMPEMPEADEMSYWNWSSNFGHFISRQSEDPGACWTWIKYLSEQPNVFRGVPSRRSVAESPEWEAYIGPEDAPMYRLALERVEPPPEEETYSPISWPFYTWRSEVVAAALKGENTRSLLEAAQRKAEDYLACMEGVEGSGLSDEELQEEIVACARRADPEGDWGP